MNRQELKQIILDQKLNAKLVTESDVRREVENNLNYHIESNLITIITGMRRVGKSTLLHHIQNQYEQSDFYLDFDDDRLIPFQVEDFQAVFELFIEIFGTQKTYFFDEIQNIKGWERFVRRLHNQGNKIYVTGSNASMLSKELGTHLTGRHQNITLYPLSFNEFLQAKQVKRDNQHTYSNLTSIEKFEMKRHFNEYVRIGGIPHQINQEDPDYLATLYDNVLYRDIIARYNLTKDRPIKMLAHYLASNIGKQISFNRLKDHINVASHATVSEYCNHLEQSYLCYFVSPFNFSLLEMARHPKKSYFNDVAMAAKIGFRHSEDHGRILENIVFLELKRRHKEIYSHKKMKECDFLIKDNNTIRAAYQVTTSMENEKTRIREVKGLVEALETYSLSKGMILTDDTEGSEIIQYNGKSYQIEIKPVWMWLLG